MRARRLLDHPAVRPLAGPAVTLVLTCLAAGWAVQIWRWRPGDPVGLTEDAGWITAWTRVVLAFGPGGTDPHLGAPYALEVGRWSTGDTLHVLALRGLGLALDPVTADAVYFMLGFPLAALTMYGLARRCRIQRPASVLVAVLFAVLPGHQTRFPHLLLAGYWTVPFGLWLCVQVAQGQPLWPVRSTGSDERRPWRTWVVNLACVLVTGLGGVYYAAFVVALLACLLVVRLWRRREPATFWGLGAAVAGIGVVLGGALMIDHRGLGTQLVTGDSPTARSPMESELFAGRAIDLVLPWAQHRVEALATLTQVYRANSVTPHPEEMAIGIVALVGIVVAVLLLLRHTLVRDASLPPLVGALAVGGLLAFAFYTKGGLGSLTALLGTASIRTWSRMSVVIAAFGLLAVGFWAGDATRRYGPRTARIIAAVLLLVGVLDQTNPAAAPAYADNASRLAGIRAFTDRLEQQVQPGCAVFQLPVLAFPEGLARNDLQGYDELLPSITSTTLRWSAGAVQGTAAADWQRALDETDLPRLADDLAAVGFCALVVHEKGYAADDPAGGLAQLLGPELSVDPVERLRAFDLGRRRTDLAARIGDGGLAARSDAVLHPVLVRLTARDPESSPTGEISQTMTGATKLQLANLAATPRGRTQVSVTVSGFGSAGRTLTLTAPDGTKTERPLAPGRAQTIDVAVDSLPSGLTEFTFAVSGAPVMIAAPSTMASARMSLGRATSEGADRVVTLVKVPPPIVTGG